MNNITALLSSLYSNVRVGEGWGGTTFRQVDQEGNEVGERFTADQLEGRLNEIKASKVFAHIQTECPHINTEEVCSEDWHTLALCYNGKEYVHDFFAYKMGTVGSIWMDPNDFSRPADQGSSDDTPTTDSSSAGN